MSVPLLDLNAQYAPLRGAILDAITRVCDSQRFIHGPEVEGLEREIEAYLGIQHALGLSSGTDAVLAALMALDIGPGDEVVTSTYSFFATAGCVARLGAKPVLVDIEPDTFNINPDAALAAVTPRTRAIIPVHLFGQSAEMMPIINASAKSGVPIIEDAAQAIGAKYRDHAVGSFGAIGCFSFFRARISARSATAVWSHQRSAGAHAFAAPRMEPTRRQLPPRRCRRRVRVSRSGQLTAAGSATRPNRALFADRKLTDIVRPPVEAPDRRTSTISSSSVPDRDGLKTHPRSQAFELYPTTRCRFICSSARCSATRRRVSAPSRPLPDSLAR